MSPLDSTSSSPNSIVDTKPVSNAIPLALDTSSASTPTNHQSVANKIQLEGEAITSKEVLEVKCPIDVEETTTVAMPRKEIAMGSKENDQKIVSAKINRKWSQEFDQHVKKNKRLETILNQYLLQYQ